MKIRRIDFSPDEWLAGTATLDAIEIGIYISACALIYSHGGPIDADELRRFMICHKRAYDRALARLVALGKLTLSAMQNESKSSLNAMQIDNKRCANEIEKASKRIARASQNGRKGGRPPKEINRIENPELSALEKLESKTNHQLPTINHQLYSVPIEGTAASAAPDDPIKALWDRGLGVLGKGGRGLFGKLRREYGDVAVLEALAVCEEQKPSDPAAFFVKCLARRKTTNGGILPNEGVFGDD